MAAKKKAVQVVKKVEPKKPAARRAPPKKPQTPVHNGIAMLGTASSGSKTGTVSVALQEDPIPLPTTKLTANLAPRLAVFQIELEYRHRADDSNMINTLIRRNSQDSMPHTALLSLVVEDMGAYPVPTEHGSDSGGIIETDGIALSADVKYFIYRAIDQFHAAADHKVSVSRAIVQTITLPGVAFII